MTLCSNSDNCAPRSGPRHPSRGSSLVEVLFALALLSILALNSLRGSLVSFSTTHKAVRNNVVNLLAMEAMEQLMILDPEALTEDETTDIVTYNNLQYTRTINITVEEDRTRTITVTVSANSVTVPATITITDSLALRGTR